RGRNCGGIKGASEPQTASTAAGSHPGRAAHHEGFPWAVRSSTRRGIHCSRHPIRPNPPGAVGKSWWLLFVSELQSVRLRGSTCQPPTDRANRQHADVSQCICEFGTNRCLLACDRKNCEQDHRQEERRGKNYQHKYIKAIACDDRKRNPARAS